MSDILEELRKSVNDYRMLLVEARNNDLALHNMNNVDLFPFFGKHCLLAVLIGNRFHRKLCCDNRKRFGMQGEIERGCVSKFVEICQWNGYLSIMLYLILLKRLDNKLFGKFLMKYTNEQCGSDWMESQREAAFK